MKTEMEFWYDPNHTGALRIIDHNKGLIYGSDPKESYWIVSFEALKKDTLIVTTGFFSDLAMKSLTNYRNCNFVCMLKLKKFNKKKLSSILKGYKKILVYDENTFYGGISPIINKLVIESNLIKQKIYYLTCPEEKQIFEYSTDRMKILEDLGIGKVGLKKKLNYISKL